MLLVCGFLGCLGHAFKRSPSTTSFGVGEHPNNTHHYGDRHHHGDRYHGRGGQPASHNGMSPSGAHAGISSSSSGLPNEHDQRAAPGMAYGASSSLAQASQYDGDLQAGAVVAAAAVAAATQPAMLVKLDRGGASRRTPLHVAAERGQLHVLSAIIESLCCSATAGPMDDDAGGGVSDVASNDAAANRRPHANGGRSQGDGGNWGGGQTAGMDQPDEELSSRVQQRHHQRGNSGAIEEFPVARPGAPGVPLAPDQYIQFHLNMQDADGTTALSLACRFGHVDCCRLLLANGSARVLCDARGNTPLHYAALRGHLGVLFMLLDEFVEPGQEEELTGYVDARNHAGCTPLHYAVWGRQSGSVQVLLQHGADVLPRNSRPAQELTPPVMVVGSTPLHLAAARGHVEICRIVLKTFAERVLEPLQLTEDDPQPPTLAALDPRVQVNANGHMPYQVAQRLGFYPLAMLLRPSIPILRLFSDEERAVRFYGPAPLRAIAAEALNKKLMAELDALAAAAAAPPRASAAAHISAAGAPSQLSRQQTQQQGSSATSGGGSGGNSMIRRPVSAPATLEQLAAAAAMDEEEARSAAGQQPGGGESAAAIAIPMRAVRLGTPQAASPPGLDDVASNSSGQHRTPPRHLHVEIVPEGGFLDSDPRVGPSQLRGAAQTSVPGPRTVGASPHPAPPRTPPSASPSGGALISPSGISPRIMSPISLVPPSPSAGLLSPTGSPYQQFPSRGSSARRSTPPLSSQRSNNSMMPAAPMVAALSRPPSAPRANGHQPGSRGQVLVSLPGQPDVVELQQLPTAGREQQASDQAGSGDAGTGGAGGSIADGGAGGADGGPGPSGMHGPRTPVRQPSYGALHVRRVPASPPGSGAAPNANGGSGCRPAASPSGAAVSSSAAAGDGSSLVRGSGDGGRPLVRLRSNPLFDDTHEHGGPSLAMGPGAAASPSAAGMPSLVEDAAEGEDGAPRQTAAQAASSCVVLMPFVQPAGSNPAVAHSAASGVGGAIAALSSYSDDEELECGVCMEPLPMVAVSPCRHQICGPCARRICCLNIQKPSHCPFCRAIIAAFLAPVPLDPLRM